MAGRVIPAYVKSIVRAIASNMPKTMLLMSSRSMPAKTLRKSNSRDGNAVEMDQKVNPSIWLPLKKTFNMMEAPIILQAMTTRTVLGFFQVISSDIVAWEYA
jgi:hypothetical protein